MREEKHCTNRIAWLGTYNYCFCFIVFLKKSTYFIFVVSLYMFLKDMDDTVMFNPVEQKPAMNLLFFQRGVGCCRACGSINMCKESDSGKPMSFKSGTVVFHFFSIRNSGISLFSIRNENFKIRNSGFSLCSIRNSGISLFSIRKRTF